MKIEYKSKEFLVNEDLAKEQRRLDARDEETKAKYPMDVFELVAAKIVGKYYNPFRPTEAEVFNREVSALAKQIKEIEQK